MIEFKKPQEVKYLEDMTGIKIGHEGGQVDLDAAKAAEIVEKHLKGGQVVTEYTIGAAK